MDRREFTKGILPTIASFALIDTLFAFNGIDKKKTKPIFKGVDEYIIYKKKVTDFLKTRNKRIDNYANKQPTDQNATHQQHLPKSGGSDVKSSR